MLALGVALHYGWAMVPPEHAAQVWNACGAVARIALLFAVVYRLWHPLVAAVAAWWAAEELMVAGCSVLYVFKPWVVPQGQAQCSSLFQLDIGTLTAVAIMLLAVAATAWSYRSQET